MTNEEINWSTTSEETCYFCKKAGIDPEVHFVQTAVIDGVVFVSGTAGKPGEFALLEDTCRRLVREGFAYFGGRETNIAKAFWKYRNLLYITEQERREEEWSQASDLFEAEQNIWKINRDTDRLFQEIKAKRLDRKG